MVWITCIQTIEQMDHCLFINSPPWPISGRAKCLSILFLLLSLWNKPVESVKCYACEFNINYCKDPHCYTNPDICTSSGFSSVLAPLQQCPRNCMLKAVTNPAGIVLKWKRLCAPANDFTKGYQCRIDYIFGARIEQCTCDKDYCNATAGLHSHWLLIFIPAFLLATFVR